MDNNTLDYLARFFGRLYDDSLKASQHCDVADCSMRKGSVCTCTEHLKDLIDMIWEAKEGRPERFEKYIEKAMAAAEAKKERTGA